MASIINTPPRRGAVDEFDAQGKPTGGVSRPFTAWFQQVFTGVFALTQSGTTAQRPTEGLWAGRMYFDTDLGANGKPIWVNKSGTGWVLADGTAA